MKCLPVVCLVLLIEIITQVSGQCQDGFQQLQGRCYKALGLEASWIEAKAYCRLLGSDLAMIDSAAEETIIEGMLSAHHGTHIDEEYWLGGTDVVTEKDWRWMATDGISVAMTTYTNWGAGQPDDLGHNQDCLLLHYRSGRTHWVDETCSALHSFICENSMVTDSVVIG